MRKSVIDPEPHWRFVAKRSLTQWYGHVHLLPDRVLGQWLCLDRISGESIWERSIFRANTIVGIAADVIIASEMRSDGPWTADLGCYGISLTTGELLWTSHGSGLGGAFLRVLDFVPGFTNDLRDSSHHVTSTECFCGSGRVIDVRDGRFLRRVSPEELKQHERPLTDFEHLAETGYRVDAPSRIQIRPDIWLSCRREGEPALRIAGRVRFFQTRDDGCHVWAFDLAQTRFAGNGHSWRYCPGTGSRPPVIYMIVSDEPNRAPDPKGRPHFVVPRPTTYRLLVLDVTDGQTVQEVVLGRSESDCRIEDVDETGLLVSYDGRRLHYFARQL
jgi:hypothetical protein